MCAGLSAIQTPYTILHVNWLTTISLSAIQSMHLSKYKLITIYKMFGLFVFAFIFQVETSTWVTVELFWRWRIDHYAVSCVCVASVFSSNQWLKHWNHCSAISIWQPVIWPTTEKYKFKWAVIYARSSHQEIFSFCLHWKLIVMLPVVFWLASSLIQLIIQLAHFKATN